MGEWLKPKHIEIDDLTVVEPIDVADAIRHLNIYDFEVLEEDDPAREKLLQDVGDAITDARVKFEDDTNHTFAERGFALYRGRPTEPFVALPVYPVQVVVSVMYLNPEGELVEWDSSEWEASVGSEADPAKLMPKPGRSWPSMLCCTDRALQVNVVAGYPPEEMPATAVRAMKMMLSHIWNNDGVTSVRAVHALPNAYDTIKFNYLVPTV